MSPNPAAPLDINRKRSMRSLGTTKLGNDQQRKLKGNKRVGIPRTLLYYKYWPL